MLENYVKPNSTAEIKEINTCAVSVVRYSGPFLKCTREELQPADRRTRKLMTVHKALYPNDDIERQYMSEKEGEWGFVSIEESVNTSIRRLEDYIKSSRERQITVTRSNPQNTKINKTK